MKKKTIFICLLHVFLWISGIFFSLIAIAIFIAYLYEDEIKQYTVKQLNTYFTTDINIQDIQLSLIKCFPNASVELIDAVIKGNNELQESDTLLYSPSILLKFNVWDLYSGNYTIRKMEVTDAELNVFIDKTGRNNFQIFKSDSSDTSNVSLELNEITIQNAHIKYHDLSNKIYSEMYIPDILLSGNFSQSQFDIYNNSTIKIQKFTVDDFTYLRKKQIIAELKLHVNYETDSYEIQTGKLRLEEMAMTIVGSVTSKKSTQYNLHLSGDQIELVQLISLLPKESQSQFQHYNSDGIIQFDGDIIKTSSKNNSPTITASFNVKNGTLTEQQSGLQLTNINLSGKYNNTTKKKEEQINISTCHASLNGKDVDLKLRIKSFNNPQIQLIANGGVALSDIAKFTTISSVKNMTGEAVFSISIAGTVNQLRNFKHHFDDIHAKGTLKMREITLELTDSLLIYKLDTATIALIDNALTFTTLGSVSDADFTCSGLVQNLPNYLLYDENLIIDASVNANMINFDKIFITTGKSTSEPSSNNVALNLQFKTKQLTYQKFMAQNVSAMLISKRGITYLDEVSFQSAGGYCSGSMLIKPNKVGYYIAATAVLKDINIIDLFQEFNNFSQTFITASQLKGIADINLNFSTSTTQSFDIITDSLKTVADVSIDGGEINEQPNLMEIADFLKENNYTKLLLRNNINDFAKRIKHIHFKTLKNQITIADGIVHIPRMEIKSNVINLILDGEHYLTNKVDYHFNFRYRELKKGVDPTHGQIKDDSTGVRIFLSMTGTTDNPVYAIDKERKKLFRQHDLSIEKQTFKSILKEEMGLFKNDTTLKSMTTPSETPPAFIINWDEFETDSINNLDTIKNNKTKFDKFLEKIANDKVDSLIYDDDDF